MGGREGRERGGSRRRWEGGRVVKRKVGRRDVER